MRGVTVHSPGKGRCGRGELIVEREDLRMRGTPDGVMELDVPGEMGMPGERCVELRPTDVGAQAPAEVPEPLGAEQPLCSEHFGGLHPHEVAPAREDLAQRRDRRRRDMDARVIRAALQALAQILRVAPIINPAQFLQAIIIGFARQVVECITQKMNVTTLPYSFRQHFLNGTP